MLPIHVHVVNIGKMISYFLVQSIKKMWQFPRQKNDNLSLSQTQPSWRLNLLFHSLNFFGLFFPPYIVNLTHFAPISLQTSPQSSALSASVQPLQLCNQIYQSIVYLAVKMSRYRCAIGQSFCCACRGLGVRVLVATYLVY